MTKYIIGVIIFFAASLTYATWTTIDYWIIATQQKINTQEKINTQAIENKSSLINYDYQKEYIDVLEKTNQQLSLWYNPYWIMIWVLGVLFAILAIFSTVIIYRQGKDYQEKLDIGIETYNNSLKSLLEEYKNKINKRETESIEIEDKINKLILQYEDKLKSSTTTQKENIQKAIDDLKLQKISLETNRDSVYVTPVLDNSFLTSSISVGIPSYFGEKTFHKCSKCGFGFKLKYDNKNAGPSLIFQKKLVTCPSCWSTDEI